MEKARIKYNPRTYEAYQLFHNGILALARAEQQGIRVDLEYIEKKKDFLTRKISVLEAKFKDTNFFKHWQHSSSTTVNIDSDLQLRHFLYGVKKLKPFKLTESGLGSTDEESLQQLNIPELNLLLERNKLKRLRDVNLDGYAREQVNGYIHPFFNLHLARTFRSSSDHPNFQNIPIRDEVSMNICRKALYPRPGHQFLEADFKGIEVGVNACYNKDETLIRYVSDPKSDMHADMAKQIFMIGDFDKSIPSHKVLRQAAKNGFVFPEFYGDYYKNCAVNMACTWGKLPQGKWSLHQGIELDTSFNLSDHLIAKGIRSLSDFESHLKKIELDFWGARFPEYAEWKDRWWRVYKKYGYFDTLTGFRCSGVMGKNDVTNYPAQGSAFHCLLWSFTEVDRIMQEEEWDTRLVGQVHDSMLLDVHPDELEHVVKTIKRVTHTELPRTWDWIIVPLDVEMDLCPVDRPWAEKEEFKMNLI
jgi:DNA polymerase-1